MIRQNLKMVAAFWKTRRTFQGTFKKSVSQEFEKCWIKISNFSVSHFQTFSWSASRSSSTWLIFFALCFSFHFCTWTWGEKELVAYFWRWRNSNIQKTFSTEEYTDMSARAESFKKRFVAYFFTFFSSTERCPQREATISSTHDSYRYPYSFS